MARQLSTSRAERQQRTSRKNPTRPMYSSTTRPGMNGKANLDTPAIQSLDRGLAILEAVASSSQPVPLKQLTDLIGIDRSSVFRLANTLRQRRFLTNPKDSKDYILGPTAWRLSRRYGRNAVSYTHL